MSIFKIIKTEFTKILKTKWLLVLFLSIAIIVVGTSLMSFDNSINSKNWKEEETTHLHSLYNELENYQLNAKNDTTGLNEMFIEITQDDIELYEYSLEHNIPINLRSVWRNVNNCTDYLWLIIIVLVIICVSIFSDDYKYGIIKQEVIRPYSRMKILLGKHLTIFTVSAVAFLTMFILSLIIGLILGGNDSICSIILKQLEGEIVEINVMNNILLMYLSNFIMCIFVIQIAIFCVVLIRNSILPLLISLGAFLCKDLLNSSFNNNEIYKYTIFPNMDLSQYIYGHEIVFTGNSLGFSLVVFMVYFSLITISTYLIFIKKDLF